MHLLTPSLPCLPPALPPPPPCNHFEEGMARLENEIPADLETLSFASCMTYQKQRLHKGNLLTPSSGKEGEVPSPHPGAQLPMPQAQTSLNALSSRTSQMSRLYRKCHCSHRALPSLTTTTELARQVVQRVIRARHKCKCIPNQLNLIRPRAPISAALHRVCLSAISSLGELCKQP